MDKKRHGKEKNPNREHSVYLVNIILLCLVTLTALGACVFLLMRSRARDQRISNLNAQLEALQGDSKTLYTEDELDSEVSSAEQAATAKERSRLLLQIQSSLESGNTTTSMLRSLFADDLVVVNDGKYYFFPVHESLRQSVVSDGDFTYDSTGALQYTGSDADLEVHRGVDVSAGNGTIDWEAVSNDGISFAMIRAGYADSDGNPADDSALKTNMQGARANGIGLGAYFVMNAADEEEARTQASYLTESLSAWKSAIQYPVAVVISNSDGSSRMQDLDPGDITNNVIAFCDQVRADGYDPAIYGNLAAFTMRMDLTRLDGYDKWISDLSSNVYFPYYYSLWQYSTSGQVQGIDGNVHLDMRVLQTGQ